MRSGWAFVGAAVLAAGCAATGFERGESAAESVRRFQASLASVQEQIGASMTALDAVLGASEQPLADRFRAFSYTVDGVLSGESGAKSAHKGMKQAGEARFRSWQEESKSIANADMKAASERRAGEVKADFDAALAAGDETLQRLAAFTADLGDYRKFLSSDLSVQGIKAAQWISENVRSGGAAFDKSVKATTPPLEKAIQSLAAAPPLPPSEPPPSEPAK